MRIGVLDSLPVYGVYFGIVLLILFSFEVGYQISRQARKRYNKDMPSTLGPMVAGLLSMLAFILAFTFSIAATQYENRKQMVLDEANAIGTAYLRADLVDAHHKTEIKSLLRDYVNARLRAIDSNKFETEMDISTELHILLWAEASSAAELAPNTNTSLLVQSINDVIDMHQNRLTAAVRNRITGSIWLTLLTISALTMVTVGFQAGYSLSRRLIAVIPLALAFAALTAVIADLDHPQKGLIKVGQQAMISLQSSMNRDYK